MDIQKGSKSFYFASLFLPKKKRQNLATLYSYLRKIDDIVDKENHKDKDHQKALTKIKKIRKSKKLISFFDKNDIPLIYLDTLIAGVTSDLKKRDYKDFDELYEYAYKVAGTVGVMICYIFDVTDKKSHKFAEKLGIAMQLTNILRDIEEDSKRAIIYLPQDDLQKFDISINDIKRKNFNKNFKRLMMFEVRRAKRLYNEGLKGVKYLPKDSQFAIKISAQIYGYILEKIKRKNYNPFTGRSYTTLPEKIYLVLKTFAMKRDNVLPLLFCSIKVACEYV